MKVVLLRGKVNINVEADGGLMIVKVKQRVFGNWNG